MLQVERLAGIKALRQRRDEFKGRKESRAANLELYLVWMLSCLL